MKTIEILVGIPCAGKSTYVREQKLKSPIPVYSVSRDEIRDRWFCKPYLYTQQNEDRVTETFQSIVNTLLSSPIECKIILDNTHCKEKDLDHYTVYTGTQRVKIKVIFFDIPLWKAYLRNVIRYVRTGKWVPFKNIKQMKINYDKINKGEYQQYN